MASPQVAIGSPQTPQVSLTNPDGSINYGNLLAGGLTAANGLIGNTNTTEAQVAGQQAGINTQQGVQMQNQATFAPQQQTGNGAFNNLSTYLGLNGKPADFSQFYNTPGYQFAVQQGTNAINRAAAANGSAYTPNTLDAVGQFVTGTASQNYNNYIQQLLSTGALGSTANQGVVNSNLSTGANIAQLQSAQGSANASGAANKSGILSSVLSALGGTSGIGSLINGLFGAGPGGSNGSGLLGSIGSGISGLLNGGSGNNLSTVDPSLGMTSTPFSNGSATGDLNQLLYPDGLTGQPVADTDSAPTQSIGDNSYLDSVLGPFSGAGGQAATSPAAGTSGTPSLGTNVGAAGNIISGIASGSPVGYASAGLNTVKLANNNSVLGPQNSTVNTGVGAGLQALGIYSGLKQGGVAGDTQAAVSGAQLATTGLKTAGAISGQTAGAVSGALGYAAIPLALYNEVKSYQSGATASDALSGAETGAAIGSVVPVIGTAVGALVGGAVGAIASAFGGGKNDPETLGVNSLDAAVASGKADPTSALAPPSAAFNYLAGVMDAKNPTPGHSQPIEQVFGRMGESNLTNQMFTQINSAIQNGTIAKNATPAQIYSSVVAPWLTSKGAAIDPNSVDLHGANAGNQLIASLQSLIGNWQNGALTSSTPIGSSGQVDTSLPAFI